MDREGEIKFKLHWEPRSETGTILGEADRCVGCHAEALCLKFVHLGDQLETSPAVCEKCIAKVFAHSRKYYREHYGENV